MSDKPIDRQDMKEAILHILEVTVAADHYDNKKPFGTKEIERNLKNIAGRMDGKKKQHALLAKESMNLDEVSKERIKNYIKGASQNVSDLGKISGATPHNNQELHKINNRLSKNRLSGISKAATR